MTPIVLINKCTKMLSNVRNTLAGLVSKSDTDFIHYRIESGLAQSTRFPTVRMVFPRWNCM